MSSMEGGNRVLIGADEPESSCKRFSHAEILLVTDNFSDQLVVGKGGFGKVYIGFIDNGSIPVAIKRLNAESKQGALEFWTEINNLSMLRHTHLVTLIGFSDDEDEMILVYEYIPNGTLADCLYGSSREEDVGDKYFLTWEQRLNICIGAACGLDYLHGKSIIHRDVKTTNILLNEVWQAKIADFGLSKVANMSQTQSHVSTDIKGTFGYLDPEYFYTRRLTMKSDVYAFGVVLLEVLCTRPAIDVRAEELERQSLALCAQKCFKKGKVLDLIDPSLREQVSPNSLRMFLKVAIQCLHKDPKKRPTMANIVRNLKLVSKSESNACQKGKVVGFLSSIAHILHIDRPNKDLDSTMTEVQAATNDSNEHQVIRSGNHTKVYKGLINGGVREVANKRRTDGLSSLQILVMKIEIELQKAMHQALNV